MEALEFGEYLKSARIKKKMTIRQLELYSEVSNAYISQLERGKRGIPSPDILKKLAAPLGLDYNELMIKAGYVANETTNKEKGEYTPAEENEYERLLRETEEKYNVNLRDDPVALRLYQELLVGIAKTKLDNK